MQPWRDRISIFQARGCAHFRGRHFPNQKSNYAPSVFFQDWRFAETHVLAREVVADNTDISPEKVIYDPSGRIAIWSADTRLSSLLQANVNQYDFFAAVQRNLLSIKIDGRCLAFSFNGLA